MVTILSSVSTSLTFKQLLGDLYARQGLDTPGGPLPGALRFSDTDLLVKEELCGGVNYTVCRVLLGCVGSEDRALVNQYLLEFNFSYAARSACFFSLMPSADDRHGVVFIASTPTVMFTSGEELSNWLHVVVLAAKACWAEVLSPEALVNAFEPYAPVFLATSASQERLIHLADWNRLLEHFAERNGLQGIDSFERDRLLGVLGLSIQLRYDELNHDKLMFVVNCGDVRTNMLRIDFHEYLLKKNFLFGVSHSMVWCVRASDHNVFLIARRSLLSNSSPGICILDIELADEISALSDQVSKHCSADSAGLKH